MLPVKSLFQACAGCVKGNGEASIGTEVTQVAWSRLSWGP